MYIFVSPPLVVSSTTSSTLPTRYQYPPCSTPRPTISCRPLLPPIVFAAFPITNTVPLCTRSHFYFKKVSSNHPPCNQHTSSPLRNPRPCPRNTPISAYMPYIRLVHNLAFDVFSSISGTTSRHPLSPKAESHQIAFCACFPFPSLLSDFVRIPGNHPLLSFYRQAFARFLSARFHIPCTTFSRLLLIHISLIFSVASRPGACSHSLTHVSSSSSL